MYEKNSLLKFVSTEVPPAVILHLKNEIWKGHWHGKTNDNVSRANFNKIYISAPRQVQSDVLNARIFWNIL